MSLSTARDTNVNSVETFLGGQCAVLLSMFDLIALIRSSHWSATEVRAPHTRCMNRAAQHHAHADRSDAIVILATVRRPPVYIFRVLERMLHHERHAIARRVLR